MKLRKRRERELGNKDFSYIAEIAPLFERLNGYYLCESTDCVKQLAGAAGLSGKDSAEISRKAVELIRAGREHAGYSNLFDALLQEYGLWNKIMALWL